MEQDRVDSSEATEDEAAKAENSGGLSPLDFVVDVRGSDDSQADSSVPNAPKEPSYGPDPDIDSQDLR